jgi:hypothetical protein
MARVREDGQDLTEEQNQQLEDQLKANGWSVEPPHPPAAQPTKFEGTESMEECFGFGTGAHCSGVRHDLTEYLNRGGQGTTLGDGVGPHLQLRLKKKTSPDEELSRVMKFRAKKDKSKKNPGKTKGKPRPSSTGSPTSMALVSTYALVIPPGEWAWYWTDGRTIPPLRAILSTAPLGAKVWPR